MWFSSETPISTGLEGTPFSPPLLIVLDAKNRQSDLHLQPLSLYYVGLPLRSKVGAMILICNHKVNAIVSLLLENELNSISAEF